MIGRCFVFSGDYKVLSLSVEDIISSPGCSCPRLVKCFASSKDDKKRAYDALQVVGLASGKVLI